MGPRARSYQETTGKGKEIMSTPIQKPTFRLQLVEVPPPVNRGRWFNPERGVMLCNLEVPADARLPLLKSCVELLEQFEMAPRRNDVNHHE